MYSRVLFGCSAFPIGELDGLHTKSRNLMLGIPIIEFDGLHSRSSNSTVRSSNRSIRQSALLIVEFTIEFVEFEGLQAPGRYFIYIAM